jgi:outer membrane protein assembly factor BamB
MCILARFGKITFVGGSIVLFALAVEQLLHAQNLVSSETAGPLGLERAWNAQVRLDPARHRVTGWTLSKETLLALTSGGIVQAFDAESGSTRWASQVAPPDRASSGPAANKDHVALISGAQLYLLNRADGRLLWTRLLGGPPGVAPALSTSHAYVAFLNGRVEAHSLTERVAPSWYFQSIGRIYYRPAATENFVTWPTDRGHLYVGQAAKPRVLYRIETDSPVTAPPAEADPMLFVVTEDGHIYCFEANNGKELWRYAMGSPASDRPAVVGDHLYVASTEPLLHALDVETGELLWSAPGVRKFAARGKKRVYGLDKLGRLTVLDQKTGAYVGTLPGSMNHQAVLNEETDRIYLVGSRGLIQCLREIGATEPTRYERRSAVDKPQEPAAGETPPAEATPAPPTVPALEEEPAEAASPFAEEQPAEAPEDPFAF